MHRNNTVQLRKFKEWLPVKSGTILDIGSYDLHGYNARQIFDKGWVYKGVDIAPGPNVDMVVSTSSLEPIGQFDVVISLNTMEHVENPFTLFSFAVNNLRPGGYMFIMAPFSCEFHRHPVDCWRYTPDTFDYMCRLNNLKLVESSLTKGGGNLVGTISDICWLAKRGEFSKAYGVLCRFPFRIRHYDCHMVGQKTSRQ